ncbi:neprilysin-2-like [Rhipicephalus microplus]|uniref:neprilysin-2-like n=1 Tax=Rhipicephalus microplus TaxID=6941 RepID=UPI003F6C7B3E
MHGYDVGGTEYDDEGKEREWATPAFLKKYTERALCLRRSHKAAAAIKARQAVINDTVDSENLADLVGSALAHVAFSSLPPVERNAKLPGLNMTAEQLFFIAYCAKWCETQSVRSARYAAGRLRCIVPLMNMAEFSDAFRCAPKSPMNPTDKCAFWS